MRSIDSGQRGAVVVVAAAVLVLVFGGLAFLSSPASGRDALVVYCAHDSIYSEDVLSAFERDTGIAVTPVFDTEATKSLGLTNKILLEKNNPRCDVFWNNQALGTAALKEEGILLPYKGPGYDRIPAGFKDPDGAWAGFAARMRVFIVNTDNMQATPEAIDEASKGDLARFALAKPLFGTTLSHFSILWKELGADRLKDWHTQVRERGAKIGGGNATTKDLVAEGVCDFAWTDSDDFYVAKDEGKPVAMLPIRLAAGKTICIPNSVAIIRGTKRLKDAQRLVDYLLSARNEIALARSKARQIPLGPAPQSQLPSEVLQLSEWATESYDVTGLVSARAECLQWLKSEYLE